MCAPARSPTRLGPWYRLAGRCCVPMPLPNFEDLHPERQEWAEARRRTHGFISSPGSPLGFACVTVRSGPHSATGGTQIGRAGGRRHARRCRLHHGAVQRRLDVPGNAAPGREARHPCCVPGLDGRRPRVAGLVGPWCFAPPGRERRRKRSFKTSGRAAAPPVFNTSLPMFRVEPGAGFSSRRRTGPRGRCVPRSGRRI
jgi:hypothetical protein